MSEVIWLIEIDDIRTEMGGRKPMLASEQKVFAEKKSVRASEFYQAYQSGLEVSVVFKIWSKEYGAQRVIKHNERYYTVVRTYEIGEFLEITCRTRQGLFEEATR